MRETGREEGKDLGCQVLTFTFGAYAQPVFFSFGKVDIGQELREIKQLLHGIRHTQEYIMALVQIDQTVLDAFGTTLGEIADGVQALVDDETNPLTDADVTGITAPIARLQEILTAPETPVEETPPVE